MLQNVRAPPWQFLWHQVFTVLDRSMLAKTTTLGMERGGQALLPLSPKHLLVLGGLMAAPTAALGATIE